MVTIKDISRACHVSAATVSKALNGYGDIGEDTKLKILETAKKMKYMPNAAARQLKTNMSYNIGVLFADETSSGLTHEFFNGILDSAKTEAENLGYDVTFITRKIGGKDTSFLEHARYRKCDGVLIASVDFKNPEVVELVQSDIPVVVIDYVYDGASSIMSDNTEGEYALTKYLIDKGHKRIAFIHGELTSVTEKRLTGFYRACAEAGIKVPDEYIEEAKYHDTNACREATEKLLKLKKPPTAILYPDDFSFIGAQEAFESMNVSVPDDVSVCGYDGIRLSQVVHPKLTTYFQDTKEIGKKSAAKLVEMIEKPKTSLTEQIMVQGKIYAGQTVAEVH
ncbi:MAG: LacI family DNA-binding transcriptional regulator [Lachnospiraceae bacterium]|nr:LacI family DNA-binding transcriptional regulator [Lachnospiraceae bacterium]